MQMLRVYFELFVIMKNLSNLDANLEVYFELFYIIAYFGTLYTNLGLGVVLNYLS